MNRSWESRNFMNFHLKGLKYMTPFIIKDIAMKEKKKKSTLNLGEFGIVHPNI